MRDRTRFEWLNSTRVQVAAASLAFLVVLQAAGLAYSQESQAEEGAMSQDVQWGDSLLRKGRFELGFIFGGAVSSNSITSKPIEGGEVSSSQILSFVNILAEVGYMVIDLVEVRLEFGLRNIHNEVGDVTHQNTWALSGALQGLYHRSLWSAGAWYGGVGLGGFYGWTNRPYMTPDNVELEADINTSGFLTELFTGLLMQPGKTWVLRGGLRFEAIFGFERPESETLGYPDQDTTNLVVMMEASVGWRL
ncbi:MAG: hypothetical protein JW797_09990 [Bradymonadales bacterium]|nr:hypothetical protein [Bradymonadales bacterium]